jgi:carbon storage regulator
MSILTVKEGEKIFIGDKTTVKVVEIRGAQIRLGIEAPDDVLILREKLAKAEKSMGQNEVPGKIRP